MQTVWTTAFLRYLMIVVQLPAPAQYWLLSQTTVLFLAVQLYTQQLTFDKTFGDHHVNAIAVYEYQGQKTTQRKCEWQPGVK